MEPQLLRVSEAARLAGIGKTFAYEFVQNGQWPSVKIGRALRIPLSGIQSWIADQEREANARAAELRAEARR